MQVIFTQDVKGVGNKGDVKEVANGYAAHFLLPQKLAVLATPAALQEIEKVAQIKQKQVAAARQLAVEAQQKLQGVAVTITAKANEEGHLFGGVESQAIADAVNAKGFKITEDQIEKREPLKNLGQHKVMIKIAEGLTAEIIVEVKGEK